MKKQIALFIFVAFIANFTFGQNIDNNDVLTKKIEYFRHCISNIEKQAKGFLNNNTTFCNDYWELNDEQQLTYLGEGKTYIEELNNNRFRITQELLSFGEDSIEISKSVTYFRGVPNANSEVGIDSSIVFGDLDGKEVVILKSLYFYNNNLLVNSTTYINMELLTGLPLGLAEFYKSNYYYDSSSSLVDEANYFLDLFGGTGELLLTDSLHYTNRSNGQAELSYTWSLDFNDNLALTQKTNYYYDNSNRLINTQEFEIPEDWTLFSQRRTEYLNNIEISTEENTYDGGQSWNPSSRDSTYYNTNLIYNFPNRRVYQNYEDEWKTSSIVVTRDCSGSSSTSEKIELDFNAWFYGDEIMFDSNDEFTDVEIMLFNIDGKILIDSEYDYLPVKIRTSNLLPGIYILQLSNNKSKSVKKLIKY